jgi:hypothetical protein
LVLGFDSEPGVLRQNPIRLKRAQSGAHGGKDRQDVAALIVRLERAAWSIQLKRTTGLNESLHALTREGFQN